MAKPETGAPHKSAAERRRQLYSDVWQLYTLTARRDSPVGGSGGNAALYKRRVRRRQGLSLVSLSLTKRGVGKEKVSLDDSVR